MNNQYQKEVVKKNLEYFNKTLTEFKDEHHAVAQSKRSHLKRFEIMLDLGDFQGKSILDVGCGIGGFYDFLKEKGIECSYTGIDINEKMIAKAKERLPKIAEEFFVCDIVEEKLDRTFDYVISVGPLNVDFAAGLNMEITKRLMEEMYRLAAVGSAISMTSSFTKKATAGTFYYDPAVILSETGKFCANVKLDHTYMPHDFTLFCYKRDLYS
ncbi:MAG: class I SAM-dependent methyltransferase [Candidatus Aminicenantes bacterium]|nr:class I SAM-dependent methyltransferase [Candidatus Aminicenantes bacterium]